MSRPNLTRRDLLKLAAAGHAAATAAIAAPTEAVAATGTDQATRSPAGAAREPLRALSAHEADLLDRIAALLIPSDEHGPGATEALAVRYIDRALAGALSEQRAAYRLGLDALERYARQTRGAPFLELSETRDLAAHRHRDGRRRRRQRRLRRQLRRLLRAGARPRLAGDVRRSVLRRQRGLRRLGSRGLPGRAHDGHHRRAEARRRRPPAFARRPTTIRCSTRPSSTSAGRT